CPITWDHFLVLLALPLAVVWVQLPRSAGARALFIGVVAVLWAAPAGYWLAHALETITPDLTVTIFSLHLYALLGLFALCLLVKPGSSTQAAEKPLEANPARAAPVEALALPS